MPLHEVLIGLALMAIPVGMIVAGLIVGFNENQERLDKRKRK